MILNMMVSFYKKVELLQIKDVKKLFQAKKNRKYDQHANILLNRSTRNNCLRPAWKT